MRKVLIIFLLLIALGALWLWRGRDFTMLADQFHLIETSSRPIDSIAYNGEGTGGTLQIGDLALSLNEIELPAGQPNIGTTKDGKLALSFGGKVFPFGPIPIETQQLRASRPDDDTATLSMAHSVLPWPNFFEINWMTGNSPKWKRNRYWRIRWKKADGAKLEMVWRYEQFFYPQDHWVEALMTRPGATGLIRVDISASAR